MKIGKMTREVLNNYFKKAATNLYPAESLDMPDKFRAKLCFYPEKCIGCKLCMRDCPSEAIVINNVTPAVPPAIVSPAPSQNPEAPGPGIPAPAVKKQFEAVIDNSRCLFCGQCVDICPKKALELTKDVELAQFDIEKLKVVFRAGTKAGSQASPEKPA